MNCSNKRTHHLKFALDEVERQKSAFAVFCLVQL